MADSLETGYSSTLSAGINTTATTIGVAAAPLSVTSGRALIGEGNKKEWINFTGVSGTNLTGVTRGLDKDASSTTDNASGDQPALNHVSGTRIRIVATHLDIVHKTGDNTISGTNTYSSTTKAVQIIQNVTTTQRDSLTGVANGTQIYNTTLGQMQWREGGAWVTNASGGSVSNATESSAGVVELATVAEQGAATESGSAGPLVPQNKNLVKTSSGAGDENKIAILDSSGTLAEGFIPTLTNTRNTIPSGVLTMWCTGTPPTDWLLCDASAVSRTTYAALFAVIGTTYGVGDGSTTFNLPDFRGRAGIGAGTGDASDATAHALADKEGTETHTLVTGEMPAHTHTVTTTSNSGTSTPDVAGGTPANTNSISTSSAGSGNAHNNLQPSLTVNFIIKT